MTDTRPLHQRADVTPVRIGMSNTVHYAPDASTTLCGRKDGSAFEGQELAAAPPVCRQCQPMAEDIATRLGNQAAADRVAEMRQVAAEAGAHVRTTAVVSDKEWRFDLQRLADAVGYLREHDPVYAAAITAAETLWQINRNTPMPTASVPIPPPTMALATADIPRVAAAPVAAPALEGVVVQHAGVSRGCAPKHAAHSDVSAALLLLADLPWLVPAELTDAHDISDPIGAECDVNGYVVEPRESGAVTVYWVQAGQIVVVGEGPQGALMGAAAQHLGGYGWKVEPMRKAARCLFAHRPVLANGGGEMRSDAVFDNVFEGHSG